MWVVVDDGYDSIDGVDGCIDNFVCGFVGEGFCYGWNYGYVIGIDK